MKKKNGSNESRNNNRNRESAKKAVKKEYIYIEGKEDCGVLVHIHYTVLYSVHM